MMPLAYDTVPHTALTDTGPQPDPAALVGVGGVSTGIVGGVFGGRGVTGGTSRPPSNAPGPSPVCTGLPLKVHEHDSPCALAYVQLRDAIPGAAAAAWQELPPQVHWSQPWSGGQLGLLATLLVPSVPCPSPP